MTVPREHLRPSLDPLYDHLDSIGESVSSSVASGSAVSLTSTTAANVTSITLTEGVWDVSGSVGFIPAASTSITVQSGGSSATTATISTTGDAFVRASTAVVPGAVAQISPIPVTTYTVAAGATQVVYLVARATFTVDTLGGFGKIQARRVSK